MPSDASANAGNKTHLVFRHKVAADDRGLARRSHETRVPQHVLRLRRSPRAWRGGTGLALMTGAPYALNRSAGGAISVTRSRTTALFESGVTVISRASRRSVQA